MKENSVKHEKNRMKTIFFLLLGIFVVAFAMYIYQKFAAPEEVEQSEDTSSSIIISNEIEDTNGQAVGDNSEEDIESVKNVVKQFISNYYTYDANKPNEYLESSKPYLTTDFYTELVLTDLEKTTVPIYSYRNVMEISFSDYTVENDIYSFVVDTKAELLDEANNKISTVEVEFHVDLIKENSEWKVSYFTQIAKRIENNE